ncbi:MAG: anthranilate synthase component I [Desulfobulbaceae bacterium]|nr:MAG: anthranilate synthase component I [Desulfobulbaceae bacterium]
MNVSPDFEEFSRRQGKNRLIPVSVDVIADLDTPLTLFSKIYQDNEQVFLFESMEGGEKWGRYSFIGFNPLAVFESKGNDIWIRNTQASTTSTEKISGDPLHYLRTLVESMNAFEDPELPRFCGGAVGYLGYDMVRFMEELPDSLEQHDLPDSSFMIPGVVMVHDSFRQTVTIIRWVDTKDCPDLSALYQKSQNELLELQQLLESPVPSGFWEKSADNVEPVSTFTSNMEPEQYHQMVEKAKEYILAGDIFQVVLSQRFHTRTEIPPLSIYRALRHINPSPYLFYIKLGEIIQIGSSPEILVRKTEDTIELRPIAGTRPRGKTPEEDLELEKELLADPKERAEHLMLVDLGRNDVGRVSIGGSVEVTDLLVIERYSHVMHIVSGVNGKIHPDYDQFDVVKACFPAGTVSGAPKIRAMEIIEELEPERRGPYAGSVGYFGFSGNMDFCITIRTFTMIKEDLWVQAGAGIVADSDPQKEFEETVNKSMGLRRAVELAETRF